MKNLVIMFIIAVSLTFMLFLLPNIQTGLVIMLTIDVFAIFLYAMIKFKQHDMMKCKYELEVKRRQELEQELLHEIDLTNSIISRTKIPSLGENLPNLTSDSR